MKKTAVVRARIAPEIKVIIEAILHKLGLSCSDAISLFLHQVALKKGLPFEVALPNAITLAAMKDAVEGRNLTRHQSLDKLKSKY